MAVARLVVDYRRTLYSRQYPDTETYEEAKSECHLRAANHLLDLCCANGGVFVKVSVVTNYTNYSNSTIW